MSVDWETFKSNLDCLRGTSVLYVDQEGSEIPIDSDLEFQEALRFAKQNNNQLKLILYDERFQRNRTIYAAPKKHKPGGIDINPSEKLLQWLNNEKKSSVAFNSSIKEDVCHCHGDVPPEWFIHYIKKFKKDLLYELKTIIFDNVENIGDKTRKFPNKKSDVIKELNFIKKNGTVITSPNQVNYSITAPNKKKKKVLERDLVDLTNQRAVKVMKKLEDWGEKSEKLEKLYNKTKFFLEEKKLEKKNFSKSKSERIDVVTCDNRNPMRKSAYFCEQGFFLFLTPGGEFIINVNIINDGNASWSAPRLKCFEFMGLKVDEPCIDLPKLLPTETCIATIHGKAGKAVGLHHLEFMLVDGEEKIGPQFTCWARVDLFEPYEEYCKVSVHSNGLNFVTVRHPESVGSFIDFETDIIANSEKKIQENIIEIEKRLQDINLLCPSTSEEATLTKNAEKPKKMNARKVEDLQTFDCDLLQNCHEKEKNWKERLEQEEIVFGFDCLRVFTETSETSHKKMNSAEDKSKMNKKVNELETTSDSELSVICMSEEDETFIVVPLPSKSPSPPVQSVNEDKRALNEESESKPVASKEQLEVAEAKEELTKLEAKNERAEQVNKETNPTEGFHTGQLSPTRTRRSPFTEENSEFKPKKMKSKSTEYYFTTANLTQPTFTPISDGFFEGKPSKFNFTGEKIEKPQQEGSFERRPSKFTFTGEKEEKSKKDNIERNIPKADALGRIIYAVNVNGYCLPVGDLFENEEYIKSPKEDNCRKKEPGNKNRSEKRNDRLNEIPAVNILPNAIMFGASNVASLAFNTAKSVINNLQSTFVTKKKTELGKPAYEDKKRLSMEAMFRLYEMGFSDLHLNQKLLLENDNDLTKVVEELARLAENSSQPQ